MRKKILYIVTKSVWGGAQRYVYDLATHLPPDQYEVVVAGGGRGPLFEKLQKSNIRFLALSHLGKDIGFLKDILSLRELWRLFLRERPDIIHLNSTKAGILGSLAVFLYRIFGGKVVTIFTVHGWVFKEDRPKIINAFFKTLSYLSFFDVDKIILLDKEDLFLAQSIVPSRKLFFIPSGIDPIAFLTKEEAIKEINKLCPGIPNTDSPTLLGTIAELNRNKGLGFLLEALYKIKSEHPELSLKAVIIGNGEQKKELEEKIRLLGLQDTLYLPGFVPEASKLLKGLDIFVLPSIKEGLPYVILEAMQAGLPIIASKVGGLPDMIEDGRNGLLVPAKDQETLAKSLYGLIITPGDRKSLGEEASKKGGDIDKMIKETIVTYS